MLRNISSNIKQFVGAHVQAASQMELDKQRRKEQAQRNRAAAEARGKASAGAGSGKKRKQGDGGAVAKRGRRRKAGKGAAEDLHIPMAGETTEDDFDMVADVNSEDSAGDTSGGGPMGEREATSPDQRQIQGGHSRSGRPLRLSARWGRAR